MAGRKQRKLKILRVRLGPRPSGLAFGLGPAERKKRNKKGVRLVCVLDPWPKGCWGPTWCVSIIVLKFKNISERSQEVS